MKLIILNYLYKITGNKPVQIQLKKFSRLIRNLMGIGTGAFPQQSGEKSALEKVKSCFSEEDYPLILFDVGANTGQFLDLIINVFKREEYLAYSFEPGSSPYNILSKKYGYVSNVRIENIGFDNIPNKSKLYFDKPNSLYASKFNRDVSRLNVAFDNFEVVSYSTIDKYCKSNNISIIHCLKVDVEGNELNVLKGASDLFDNHAIKTIIFEFGSTQIDSKTFFKDIYFFLKMKEIKYLLRILPNGYLLPISKYDEELEAFFTTNYLAIMD